MELTLNATDSWQGLGAVSLFVCSYVLVMLEERIGLRKSKPVMLVAGLIWILVAWFGKVTHNTEFASAAFKHTIEEYAELFLFLLVAMTFVNILHERKVFDALRSSLVNRQFNLRQLFWGVGFLTFFISSFADNLTAALLMCHVVLAIGKDRPQFVSLSLINIVVAANAGGVFSPFGDVTTLMVWQHGALDFFEFFRLFFPALISYLIPAFWISLKIPKDKVSAKTDFEGTEPGALGSVLIFAFTLVLAVVCQVLLKLPAVLGMMTGLGLMGFYAYFLERKQIASTPINLIEMLHRIEWDTLLFFYGVLLAVSGLGAFGYLADISTYLYKTPILSLSQEASQTVANILIGLISAVVDNIPVVYAVLAMGPEMSTVQWLLMTLTAGIGGSLLSVGSAAGVALMGQAPGQYTFFSHLKFSLLILLGYFAAVFSHLLINQ